MGVASPVLAATPLPYLRGRGSSCLVLMALSKQGPERVFFIVDQSRLKDERDELKDAVVVYMPDGDLKKVILSSLHLLAP